MNLKSRFTLLILLSIGMFMSCKNSSYQNESTIESEESIQDSALVAILEMEDNYSSKDSMKLTFSVFNPTADSLSFTKYHTAFEGFMNNFLTIVDSDGNEVVYQGAMAKRIMPPVKESYVVVAPNSTVSTSVDISQAYRFTESGTYIISYNGGNVSGMKNGKSIQITLD